VDLHKPTVALLAPVSTGVFYTTSHTPLFAADAADPAPGPGITPSGVQKVDFLYQLKSALPPTPSAWVAGDFIKLWTSNAPGYMAVWGGTSLADGDYVFAVRSTD
ncbi:MAG: hypothetical protein M1337_08870, partial [Actinobacteria bacterium]|nr:hypothetical protein [Actinomycetota bacterium]